MTMPERFLAGQISGQQLGQAIFNFLPSLPGEGPPGMPRFLAKQLFPNGFVPGALPAAMAPPVVQPPVVQPPVAAARPPAAAAVPQPPAPPAPAARVDRRVLDSEMVTARSIRQVVKERRGML
ncbi:hypothetical protein ES703_79052 [subsurface metagenome]